MKRNVLVQGHKAMLPAFVVDDSVVVPVDKDSNEETLKMIYARLGELTGVKYSKRRQAYRVSGRTIRETFKVDNVDENGYWFVFMRSDLILNTRLMGLINRREVLFTFRDFLGL